MTILADDGIKAVSVQQLRSILAGLPADAWVWPNRVGNLAVTLAHPDEGGDLYGWIDLLFDGEIELAVEADDES